MNYFRAGEITNLSKTAELIDRQPARLYICMTSRRP
jgi:hypothetical protein